MPKKKKSAELTPRQQLSQRIMREKAARKKRLALRRRVQIAAAVTGGVVLLGGGGWFLLSGTASQLAQNMTDGAYKMTARAGFSIQAVYLEGRDRTAMADIEKALALDKGQSIFRVDLDETRKRLETIESVRAAAVERALPHTLYVRIAEREPVAIWQHEGKLVPVDDHGVVMHGIEAAPYQHLPLITGIGAPEHITELMTVLASEPELSKRFAAAIYTGNRRWNIRLENDIEVKLPEQNPVDAWKALAKLHQEEHILDRSVKAIDLRLGGRLFITTTSPQTLPKREVNAKET